MSFGGTILVDGDPFGLTVHHMLDIPSDDEEDDDQRPTQDQPKRAAAPAKTVPGQFDPSADVRFMQSEEDLSRFSDFEISDDEYEGSDDDSDTSTIRPDYAIMDADGNEFWFLEDSPPELDDDDSDDDDGSSSSSDDVDDAASIGDKVGIAPYTDDDFCVTQPAIDDVDDDFFPSEEDRDDDHLASHSFGYVFATSGIRRVKRGEIKHEVDWALIRVNGERLKVENAMREQPTPSGPTPQRGQSATRESSSRPAESDSLPVLTSVTPSQVYLVYTSTVVVGPRASRRAAFPRPWLWSNCTVDSPSARAGAWKAASAFQATVGRGYTNLCLAGCVATCLPGATRARLRTSRQWRFF